MQGVVILEAVIGADGKVQDLRVLRSIPLLDEAALAAVRDWEYTPTLLNGEPYVGTDDRHGAVQTFPVTRARGGSCCMAMALGHF